jgi:hypothetical protein
VNEALVASALDAEVGKFTTKGGEMYRAATDEIREAAEAAERRRGQEQRRRALMRGLDSLLSELEELHLNGVTVAPQPVRRRASILKAMVLPLDALIEVPESVLDLMESIYDIEDVLLVQRQHGLGVEKAPAA